MGPDQTGVLTDNTSVNPAQAPQPLSATPNFITAPATPDPALVAQYENRVRALMSEKDKTKNDYERAVAERLEVQNKLSELERNHSNMTAGATQAIEQALNESKAKDAELAKARAANTKLQALMSAPELLPYSALIPETEDAAQVQAAIANLKEVRQRDIDAQLAARVPQAPAAVPMTPEQTLAQLRGAYPSQTYIPPATPAAPSGSPSGSTAENVRQRLDIAMREAQQKNDMSIFEREFESQRQIAEASARQQYQ